MARSKNASPSYLLHRQSGQARVRIDGKEILLGKFNSPESWEKYHRLVAHHLLSQGSGDSAVVSSESPISVAELLDRYDDFARRYYVKNGQPTDERYRAIVTPLVQLYGSTPAKDFGPLKLKAFRQHIAARGSLNTAKFDETGKLVTPGEKLSRTYLNNLIKSLVRIFKWAASEELLPAGVHESLCKVDGLKKGKASGLAEPQAVKPVPEEHLWPVVRAVPPQIAAMIEIQYLTGGRPGEITIMRPCDIDRSGTIWSYRPASHKVENYEINREILLGPKVQVVLKSWLEGRDPTAYLFSPREAALANAEVLETRRKKKNSKKKKVSISEKRPPREHYDDSSYRQAVVRACERVGVPKWTPGQLRHNAGTRVRQKFGAEAAQLVLGHNNLSTTEIYAEKDRRQYAEIIKQLG